PASQEAVLHLLITVSVQKDLVAVVTSHSPKIVQTANAESLVFLFRKDGNVKSVEGLPPPALLGLIGIDIPTDIVVCVEDEAAKYFLRQILELHNPRLSRRIEISVRNGEGNITALLSKIGTQFEQIKVIGVYDGDRRGKLLEAVAFAATVLP